MLKNNKNSVFQKHLKNIDREDIERLSKLNIHGAIIGKAYYTGAINLKNAIEVAKWLQKE